MRAFAITPLIFLALTPLLWGDERRTVSVVGVAVAQVDPDNARITLAVVLQGNDLPEIKKQVDQTLQDVAKAVQSVGVDKDGIKTGSIGYSTFHEREAEGELEKLGQLIYRVEREIVFVVPVRLVESVIGRSTQAGANRINEIRYMSSNQTVQREVLSKAIANAKEQAAFLAESFGAKLGKVLTISANRFKFPANLSLVVSAPQDAYRMEPYGPQEISVDSRITVVFQLTD